jgi:hypothetical protein
MTAIKQYRFEVCFVKHSDNVGFPKLILYVEAMDEQEAVDFVYEIIEPMGMTVCDRVELKQPFGV